MRVEPQESQQRARDGEAERHQVGLPVQGGDDAVRGVRDRGRVPRQGIQAVGQIDRVRCAHNRQRRQRDHQKSDFQWSLDTRQV